MRNKFGLLVLLLLIPILLVIGSRTARAQLQLPAVNAINPEFGFPAWFQDPNGVRLQLCDTPGAAPCPSAPVGFLGETAYYAVEASIDPLEPPFIQTPNGERFIGVFAVEALGGVPAPGIVSNSIRIRLRNLVVAGDYTVTTPVGQFVLTAVNDGGVIQDINFIFPVPGAVSTVGEGLPTDVPPFSGALAGPIQTFQQNGTCPNPGICTDGFFGDGVSLGPLPGILGTLPIGGPVTGGPQNIFRVDGPAVVPAPFNPINNVNTTLFVVEGKRFVLEPPQQTVATFTRDATGAGSVNVKAIGVIGATTVDVVGSDNIGASVPLPGEDLDGFLLNPVPGEIGNFSTAAVPDPESIEVTDTDDLPVFVRVTLDRNPLVPPAVPAQTATQIAPLTDAVTISEATFDAPTGVLTITASSSDAFPNPALPVLTVVNPGPPAVLLGDISGSGTLTINDPNPVPTTVNVTSDGGGRASLAVAGAVTPPPDPGTGTPPAVGGGGGGGGCFIGTVMSE